MKQVSGVTARVSVWLQEVVVCVYMFVCVCVCVCIRVCICGCMWMRFRVCVGLVCVCQDLGFSFKTELKCQPNIKDSGTFTHGCDSEAELHSRLPLCKPPCQYCQYPLVQLVQLVQRGPWASTSEPGSWQKSRSKAHITIHTQKGWCLKPGQRNRVNWSDVSAPCLSYSVCSLPFGLFWLLGMHGGWGSTGPALGGSVWFIRTCYSTVAEILFCISLCVQYTKCLRVVAVVHRDLIESQKQFLVGVTCCTEIIPCDAQLITCTSAFLCGKKTKTHICTQLQQSSGFVIVITPHLIISLVIHISLCTVWHACELWRDDLTERQITTHFINHRKSIWAVLCVTSSWQQPVKKGVQWCWHTSHYCRTIACSISKFKITAKVH